MPHYDIGKISNYGAMLDSLIRNVGSIGTTEISITLNGHTSTNFRIRNSDLYIEAYHSNGNWVNLVSENYNDMASPTSISKYTIEAAIQRSANWGVMNSTEEPHLKLLIFVISEASRFMVIRFAVNRAINQGHTFAYDDFSTIFRNWSSLRERCGHALITVDDIQKNLGQIKPTWGGSGAQTRLTASHLLF